MLKSTHPELRRKHIATLEACQRLVDENHSLRGRKDEASAFEELAKVKEALEANLREREETILRLKDECAEAEGRNAEIAAARESSESRISEIALELEGCRIIKNQQASKSRELTSRLQEELDQSELKLVNMSALLKERDEIGAAHEMEIRRLREELLASKESQLRQQQQQTPAHTSLVDNEYSETSEETLKEKRKRLGGSERSKKKTKEKLAGVEGQSKKSDQNSSKDNNNPNQQTRHNNNKTQQPQDGVDSHNTREEDEEESVSGERTGSGGGGGRPSVIGRRDQPRHAQDMGRRRSGGGGGGHTKAREKEDAGGRKTHSAGEGGERVSTKRDPAGGIGAKQTSGEDTARSSARKDRGVESRHNHTRRSSSRQQRDQSVLRQDDVTTVTASAQELRLEVESTRGESERMRAENDALQQEVARLSVKNSMMTKTKEGGNGECKECQLRETQASEQFQAFVALGRENQLLRMQVAQSKGAHAKRVALTKVKSDGRRKRHL